MVLPQHGVGKGLFYELYKYLANNTEFSGVGLEAAYYIKGRWGVSASVAGAFRGEIIAAAPAYSVGVFYDLNQTNQQSNNLTFLKVGPEGMPMAKSDPEVSGGSRKFASQNQLTIQQSNNPTMTLRTLIFSTLLFALLACGPTATAPTETTQEAAAPAPLTFSEKVEAAHQKGNFRSHEAIQFDLQLFFGGTERLNGTLTLSTDSRKALIAYKDGKKIYVQDDKMFVAPGTENLQSTRFAAYTWSYFFMLPYKLNDGGTVWSDYPDTNLNGDTYATGKLSFTPGTGDAPDDWYIIYADTETLLTQVAAYIVTAGQSQAEAEEDPHAIQYLNYQQVEGIPMATEWKFWGWQPDQGLTKQLGVANLRNISFVTPAEGFFTPPAEFVEG